MLLCSRLQLIAACALVLAGGASALPRAIQVGTYVWTGEDPHFGGFSGFDLDADGLGFVTISDSAAIYAGRLSRDEMGVVTGVASGDPIVPPSHHGTPVAHPMDDAEGLAIRPDGTLFVSYETHNRIAEYRDGGKTWVKEFWPTVFRLLPLNKGIEALAIAGDGALYALPEAFGRIGDPIPVFRLRDGALKTPFTLRRDGGWQPVGADFGPDGRLYVLERDFWPFIGFMSRARRITLAGDTVSADEILFETSAGVHDNLEGIAVWQDESGAIRLTMISDDNFLPVQRTEIVDYRIVE
ncbi:MAG: esterase-like activity of phytase family protein [Albidovulum sp.]|uniref:esterase-like activity of phytase family protein n=1 Tax=Albidovulum sp. TaxID=1872424 RepID=UPI003CA7F964